ncbi:restriction endonuclease subunit S, partial [Brachyspira hampsonii]
EEQKKIASILSSLDDKIELNNRMNKILEEMAQTIFKEWFVNFNFPGEDGKPYKDSGGKMIESELGEIPEGWRVGTIGEYSKVKSGFAFKSSWWIDKGIPVIKIQNVSSENINIEECSFVDEDKYKAAEIFRVNAGDLLIAMTGATLGKFAIVPKLKKDALVNQRVGKFFLGDDPIKKLPFIYSLLKLSSISNIIVSLGTGSAQPNISPTDIENIKIVYPNEDILNKYNQYTEKIFIKIINARDENHKLASIRDTLLPRLMSGEIR